VRASATNTYELSEQIVGATITGTAVELPAGKLGMAFGAEWRKTTFAFNPDSFLSSGDATGFGPSAPTKGDQSVKEIYAEAQIPLLADMPFVHYLGLDVGGRYSKYSGTDGVWTYKLLGEFSPLEQLKIRGGFQRAIRAPNIVELFQGEAQGFPTYTDPCAAGNQPVAAGLAAACTADGVPGVGGFTNSNTQVQATTSGNPDLKPEKSDTYTIGAVWRPTFISGTSVTVDYYNIKVTDAIDAFGGGAPFVVFGCIFSGGQNSNPFCAAYDRGPDGEVLIVNTPNANISTLRASGVDVQLNFNASTDWGLFEGGSKFNVNWAGSYRIQNKFQANKDVAAIECAGYFGAPCGQSVGGVADPKYKFTSRFTYNSGPLTASLRWRWLNSTTDARVSQALAFKLPDPKGNIPAEALKYGSASYFDLAFGWEVNKTLSFNFGVNNLLDKGPPIVGAQQVQSNTDPSNYDVLGRRFFVAASLQF
jgi:iron complex outermembrane recepter protein